MTLNIRPNSVKSLLFGLIAGTIGYVLLAPMDAFSFGQKTWSNKAYDPPTLGLHVDSLGTLLDIHRRTLPMHSKLLLLGAGDCQSCSRDAIEFSKLPHDSYDGIVLVYQNSESALKKDLPLAKLGKVFAVADVDGTIYRTLNVGWTGQWFEFEGGHLQSVQLSREVRP